MLFNIFWLRFLLGKMLICVTQGICSTSLICCFLRHKMEMIIASYGVGADSIRSPVIAVVRLLGPIIHCEVNANILVA